MASTLRVPFVLPLLNATEEAGDDLATSRRGNEKAVGAEQHALLGPASFNQVDPSARS